MDTSKDKQTKSSMIKYAENNTFSTISNSEFDIRNCALLTKCLITSPSNLHTLAYSRTKSMVKALS